LCWVVFGLRGTVDLVTMNVPVDPANRPVPPVISWISTMKMHPAYLWASPARSRSSAADSAFLVNSTNAGTIGEICRRLDCIPLAIELAAARVGVLALEHLNSRLQDQFRLLTGATRTAVARQRTLEATVEWSYQLLSDLERVLLNRLSVFAGGWTLEAAEDVCADDRINTSDVLEVLSRLVRKSLVSLDTAVDGGRYHFLETVRQYARGRVGETDDTNALRDRHFRFFFSEFRGAFRLLRQRGQVTSLRRLRVEQENIRAALESGLTSPASFEKSLELAGALFWFWAWRGQFERYFESVRASLGAGSFERARSEGRAMLPDHAIAFAREQVLLTNHLQSASPEARTVSRRISI
jgi:predicted ATPase